MERLGALCYSRPPCFWMCHCCNENCEDNKCCYNIGTIGLKWFDKHRADIMGFATFISVICLALNLVAVAAMSTVPSDVENTAWTIGELDAGAKAFTGLEEIVVKYANGDYSQATWNSDACSALESSGTFDGSFCRSCEEAATKSIPVAIMAVVTKVPTIATDIKRSTRRGDMNCQKFMGMLTALISLFSTIDSLSVYADGCYRNLPTEFDGIKITWRLGPGFICLLISTLLGAIDFIVNLLMPVTPCTEEERALGTGNEVGVVIDQPLGTTDSGKGNGQGGNVAAKEVEMADVEAARTAATKQA